MNRKKLKKDNNLIKSFTTINCRKFAIIKIIINFNEKLNVDKKLNNNKKLNVINLTLCTNEKNAKFDKIKLNDKKLKKKMIIWWNYS